MYGFNLLNGGREDNWPNCDSPDQQQDCAMTAAEVREVADTLAAIGGGKGCGVNGWEIDAAAGAARNYFFRQDIQSALGYLNSKVGGLQPGPC
jgi:hypothetical protein